MYIQSIGTRQVGLAAAAVMALGVVTAASAHAAIPRSPSASVANDTLTIVGNKGDDAIAIGVSATDPNTLLVDLGNGTRPQTFDRTTFTAIAAFLGLGDDQFHVVAGGSLADEALSVDGGAGNDTITGGDGNDTLFGGAGADNIQGGDGTDLIFGGGGNDVVDGGRGNDTEILGAGQDTALWNPGEGSDFVDGGAGRDSLTFNGSNANEVMSLSANGTRAVLLRDVGGIRMDLATVERVDVAALGGTDVVTIDNLAGTDVRDANVDLGAQGTGDGQPDVVTVNGTNAADRVRVSAQYGTVDVTGLRAETHVVGSETDDALHVYTLGGNDSARVSNAAKALIGVVVDLGTGQR